MNGFAITTIQLLYFTAAAGKENAASGRSQNSRSRSGAGGPEQRQSKRPTKPTPKAVANKCPSKKDSIPQQSRTPKSMSHQTVSSSDDHRSDDKGDHVPHWSGAPRSETPSTATRPQATTPEPMIRPQMVTSTDTASNDKGDHVPNVSDEAEWRSR